MKPKWHANLIAVCEKCGTKMSQASGAPNPALGLKDWLKKQLLARDLWGTTRVITSSCLDSCPEGKVAVAFTGDHPRLESRIEEIDPEQGRDRILQLAVERAKTTPA